MAQWCCISGSVLGARLSALFLTDGYKEYATALLTHFGHWVQPPRRKTKDHTQPRWMPRPELRYAQVIKTTRRRRLCVSRTAWCLALWKPSSKHERVWLAH